MIGDPSVTVLVSMVSLGSCLGTVDIEIIFSKDFRTLIDRISTSVEYSAQHVFGDRELHATSGKLDMGSFDVDAGSTLEDLDDSFLALDFENLTTTLGSIWESELHNFVVGCELRCSQ